MSVPARPLSELSIGASGRVVRIDGPGEVRGRLLEMGLTAGATVKLVRTAPPGDPLELMVRGYRLSVRRSEAAAVIVEAVE